MELKQFYFITAKNGDELKASYILHGSEGDVQFLGQVVDSNKLVFGGVQLPARLDDRVLHLKKYCSQYGEFRDLLPSLDSSQKMGDIMVQLIETGVVMETMFSDELKEKVVGVFNVVKERGGPVVDGPMEPKSMEVEPSDLVIAPARPVKTQMRKPSEPEIQLRQLLEKSETLYNSNVRILKAISELHKEMVEVRSRQDVMNNRLDDVANASIEPNVSGRKFRCTFCEYDEHGFKECDQKAQCINCGLDNHKADKCFWVGNKCTRCGVQGHASKLHLATDLKFRLAIMNTHGPESFAHFWADEERKEDNLAHRVIQPIEQAAPAEPIEKGRGGSGTGGYWSNQAGRRGRGAYAGKGGRHQESKPYYRQQIDPWTAPGNSRGSKKSKR